MNIKQLAKSVYAVRSRHDSNGAFGTAFVVKQTTTTTYLLTCAHVVRDVGGEDGLLIRGQPAQVVAAGEPEGADDLAVLSVERLDGRPLRLAHSATAGRPVIALGARNVKRQYRLLLIEPVTATLGQSAALDDRRGQVAAWTLDADVADRLREGYSGSPVIDAQTGEVLGVTVYKETDGRSLAIAARAVSAIWPDGVSAMDGRTSIRGIEYVYVPAGSFIMGTPEPRSRELADIEGRDDYLAESPQHKVFLKGFYIARYPVTNRQYADFVRATGHRVPQRDDKYSAPYSWTVESGFPLGREDYPVVLVSWLDVRAYSRWLGVRIPSEAEWEKAARGDDGRTWPWGDEWVPDRANTWEGRQSACLPVGALSPQGDSPYGAADMSGNVWEWCNSIKENYPYVHDTRETVSGRGHRVIRGGAWGNGRWDARCAARRSASEDDFGFSIGFRVAVDDDVDVNFTE